MKQILNPHLLKIKYEKKKKCAKSINLFAHFQVSLRILRLVLFKKILSD
mgnify:CR=1 FL=1